MLSDGALTAIEYVLIVALYACTYALAYYRGKLAGLRVHIQILNSFAQDHETTDEG